MIETPFFMFNSKYDHWQLGNGMTGPTIPVPEFHQCVPLISFIHQTNHTTDRMHTEFQSPWTTKAEQLGVLEYGKDFMTQLVRLRTWPISTLRTKLILAR